MSAALSLIGCKTAQSPSRASASAAPKRGRGASPQAEAALAGKAPGDAVFRAAAEAAAKAIDPLEDHQTDADYRRDLVRAVVRRALEQAHDPESGTGFRKDHAKTESHAGTQDAGTNWVGRSIRRLEDPALVRGQGRFTADLPATRCVRFVRSPVASGTIDNIDMPAEGAIVITAAASKASSRSCRCCTSSTTSRSASRCWPTAIVRFVGEPIAAVVAASKARAEDLAEEVDAVDPRHHAGDRRRARARCRRCRGCTPKCPATSSSKAGVKTQGFDTAWAGAHKIVKLEARSHRQNATPIETRAGHAAYDAATGRITLTCTTQMPHLTRTAIADLLGMPESDLRVIAPDVGGGFGQKMSLAGEYVLLVWLARRLKSSVAWAEDRRENLIAGFHSRDQTIALEGAFDRRCAN